MFEKLFGGKGTNGDVRLPAARNAGLILTATEDELVIYDMAVKKIHHLDAVSAAVWQHCDGRRTVAEVAVAATEALGAKVDVDAVAIAAAKLDEARLLVEAVAIPRMSRRIFGRRVAMAGAAAVPAVVSITAPHASASASGGCNEPWIPESACTSKRRGLCCYGESFDGNGVCDSWGGCEPN